MSDSDEELAEVERQMTVLRAAKQTALQKAPPKPYDPRAESSDDDEPGPGTRLAPAGVSKYLAETNRKDIASAKSKVRMANKHGRVPVAGDPDEDAMWADLLQGLSLGKFSSASPFRRQCAQIIFSKRFDQALSVIILINTVILLNTRPEAIAIHFEMCNGCGVSEFWFMVYIDFFFLSIFTVEAIVKIIALGFFPYIDESPAEKARRAEQQAWMVEQERVSKETGVPLESLLAASGGDEHVLGKTTSNAYLADPWNQLDFVVVTFSWGQYAIYAMTGVMMSFSGFRSLRLLTVLAKYEYFDTINDLIKTFFDSWSLIRAVLALLCFFLFFFGLLGIEYFGASLDRRCVVTDLFTNLTVMAIPERWCGVQEWNYGCSGNEWCQEDFGNPYGGHAHFDNIGGALLIMMQCMSLEGWWMYAYATMRAEHWSWYIFFILLIFFLNWLVSNLFAAVICATFAKIVREKEVRQDIERKEALLLKEAEAEEAEDEEKGSGGGKVKGGKGGKQGGAGGKFQVRSKSVAANALRLQEADEAARLIQDKERSLRPGLIAACAICITTYEIIATVAKGVKELEREITSTLANVSQKEIDACDHDLEKLGALLTTRSNNESGPTKQVSRGCPYNHCINALIVLNTLEMMTISASMSPQHEALIYQMDLMFLIIFALDIVLQWAAQGFNCRRYIARPESAVDLFLTLSTTLAYVLQKGQSVAALRSIRLFYLLSVFPSLAKILKSALSSSKRLINISVLLLILTLLAIILGKQMYGGEFNNHPNPEEQPRNNYDTWPHAMYSLLRVTTADDWQELMFYVMGLKTRTAMLAPFFHIGFLILTAFIMLPLFIAVIVENFELSDEEKERQQAFETQREESDDRRMACIRSLPFFEMATKDVIARLAQSLEEEHYAAGDIICTRDAYAEKAFFLIEGQLNVMGGVRDDRVVNTMQNSKLDRSGVAPFFGEMALMASNPKRRATIEAETDLEIFALFRTDLDAVIPEFPGVEKQILKMLTTSASSRKPLAGASTPPPGPQTGRTSPNSSPATQRSPSQRSPSTPNGTFRSASQQQRAASDVALAQMQKSSSGRRAAVHNDEDMARTALSEEGSCCPSRKNRHNYALLCFSPNNAFRVACHDIARNKWFSRLVLLAIVISSAALAMETPERREDPRWTYAFIYTDLALLTVFLFEFMVKNVAFGFYFTKKGYMKSKWNWLDLVCLLVSANLQITFWSNHAAGNTPTGGGNGYLRVLRMGRVLRPLRMIQSNEGLRVVVQTLLESLPAVVNVICICLLFMLVLALVGVRLFGGWFHRCSDDDLALVPTVVECTGQFYDLNAELVRPRVWAPPQNNFDDLGLAFFTIFKIVTLDNWREDVFQAMDMPDELGQQPKHENSRWFAFYHVFCLVLCNFFLMQLFIGVMIDNFNTKRKINLLTPEQKAFMDISQVAKMYQPMRRRPPPNNPVRRALFRLMHWWAFDNTIAFFIVCNVIIMATKHRGQSDGWNQIHFMSDVVFMVIFTLEVIIRFTALGPKYWAKDRWNVFDFAVVSMSIVASPLIFGAGRAAFTVQLGRVVRIFRLFKVVKRSDSLRTMFNTLYASLPALLNIGILIGLLGFVFQIMGLQFYSDTKLGEGLSGDCNFRDLTSVVILLMRVLSGDWWQIMLDVWTVPQVCTRSAEEKAHQPLWVNPAVDAYGNEKEWSDCGGMAAPLYFIAFIMLGQCMMLNLLLAVIMDKFSVAYNLEHAPINPKHLIAYRDAWSTYDKLCYGAMPTEQIEPFVRSLGSPLVPQPIVNKWFQQVQKEWTHESVMQVGILGKKEKKNARGETIVTGKEEGVLFQDILEILMVSMLGEDKYLTFKARKQRKLKFTTASELMRQRHEHDAAALGGTSRAMGLDMQLPPKAITTRSQLDHGLVK